MRVSERPKPEEQPVISQVSCFLGVVKVADMVAGFGFVKFGEFEGNQFSEVSKDMRIPIRSGHDLYMLQSRLIFCWTSVEIKDGVKVSKCGVQACPNRVYSSVGVQRSLSQHFRPQPVAPLLVSIQNTRRQPLNRSENLPVNAIRSFCISSTKNKQGRTPSKTALRRRDHLEPGAFSPCTQSIRVWRGIIQQQKSRRSNYIQLASLTCTTSAFYRNSAYPLST